MPVVVTEVMWPQRYGRPVPEDAPRRFGPRDRARRRLLRVFGRLPAGLRALVARRASVAYYVGAAGFVVAEDLVLLVRLVYRSGWGAPGGLVAKGEAPPATVVRELREELGLEVAPTGEPFHDVDPERRGVEVWFPCALVGASGAPRGPGPVPVRSAELDAAAWFPLGALPSDLHPESARALRALDLVPREGGEEVVPPRG